MLPKPSFLDELARFPAKVHTDLIARLQADDDIEFMWDNLTEAIPGLDAQDFIKTVFNSYGRSIGRIRTGEWLMRECRTWRAKYETRLKQLLQNRPPDTEFADRLEDIAGGLRLNVLLESFIPESSRQNRTGWRHKPKQTGLRSRRLFALELSRFFYDRCRQWRDEEVALLTRVAFGLKSEFGGDNVRELRRKRQR